MGAKGGGKGKGLAMASGARPGTWTCPGVTRAVVGGSVGSLAAEPQNTGHSEHDANSGV